MLAGCGPNLYSLPFLTSRDVNNGPALAFLTKGGPPTLGGPDSSLTVKDPYADGRVLVLTVSGGGMRASAFTLGILAGLDEMSGGEPDNTAFDEIDLISSVSGGSWAVSAVLVDRIDHRDEELSRRVPAITANYAKLEKAKVRHWAQYFIPAVTDGKTFAEVYPAGVARPSPFTYFNASLYPSHSPFVFTRAYLDFYGVTAFGDPANPRRITAPAHDLTNIPIGYAATASSAVPGYTSAFAETSLCDAAPKPSFCFGADKGKDRRDLQLMDGGVYDNLGYKTALEWGLADRDRIAQGPATVIMIDSSDVEYFQTLPRKQRESSHAIGLATAGSFPNQNAGFDRLRDPAFRAAGFDQRLLLDFAAAANFTRKDYEAALTGLPELAYYAAHDVGCFDDQDRAVPGITRLVAPKDPGSVSGNLDLLERKGRDCLTMNFARAGYLYKTTFKYNAYAFLLRYQLGRMVVRLHRDAIMRTVFRTARTDKAAK